MIPTPKHLAQIHQTPTAPASAQRGAGLDSGSPKPARHTAPSSPDQVRTHCPCATHPARRWVRPEPHGRLCRFCRLSRLLGFGKFGDVYAARRPRGPPVRSAVVMAANARRPLAFSAAHSGPSKAPAPVPHLRVDPAVSGKCASGLRPAFKACPVRRGGLRPSASRSWGKWSLKTMYLTHHSATFRGQVCCKGRSSLPQTAIAGADP